MLSKILLGLSILLMAGAAVLGYLTKGKIDEQKAELATRAQKIVSQESTISKRTAELKAMTDEAAAAKARGEQLATELATTKADLETSKAAVAEGVQKLADVQKKLDEALATANPAGPGAPDPQVAELTKKLTDTEMALKEAQQVRDSLQERVNTAEAQTKELQVYKDTREKRMVAVGLEGQVLAVNQAWSFVVLSIGDRQGVIANTEMIVKRGGQQIARVRVSSVEPGSAVADIVPGSLRSGVTVQPGDVVIYKGS